MRSLGGEYYSEAELRAAGFKRLGRDVRIHNRASLYGVENISLGDHVRIDDFTIVIATGEVSIGSHVHIATHCFLGAKHGLVLSDFVGLAPGVKLFTGSDDYTGFYLTNATVPAKYTGGRHGPVVLERHVLIGANTVILPRLTIGEGSSVGAQALVTMDLAPWGVYVGAPARRLMERERDLLELEQQLLAEEAEDACDA